MKNENPEKNVIQRFPHCILKRAKGRSSIELYVYDKDMQEWLEQNTILVPTIDLGETQALQKKMRTKDKDYALFLAIILEKVQKFSSQKTLEQIQASIPTTFKANK